MSGREARWHENAVIYAVDVEVFQDSNGDGVGGFQGLASRLDYLSRLGVDCLWLLPFYPSPNRDNGYDAAGYYGVDPDYGTLGDFVDVVPAARERGIRRRLAPMLDGHRRRLELAFALLFSMPGAPLLVYGDEIGMGEKLSLPGRTAVRTPMQRSDAANAGFSTADPENLVRPVVAEGPFAAGEVNVADQRATDGSLLDFVDRLIGTRHEAPVVGRGEMTVLDAGDAAPTELLGRSSGRLLDDGRVALDIDGYDFRWLRVDRGA